MTHGRCPVHTSARHYNIGERGGGAGFYLRPPGIGVSEADRLEREAVICCSLGRCTALFTDKAYL